MKQKNKIFIVIPAYNEEKRISNVISDLRKYKYHNIIVDDGSNDKTSEIAKKSKVVVLRLKRNKGKGTALRIGCDFAVKKGANVIISMDADGQHEPEEIPRLIAALENKDIVLTYRRRTKTMPLFYRIGNLGIDFITRVLYRAYIRDTQSGYKAFTAEAYRKIRWKAKEYAVESEIIHNMLKNRLKFVQVPIRTVYHEKYKGTNLCDGIKIFFRLVKLRFFG